MEMSIVLLSKKGLNVLVGENDPGKSAIMDAIKLVLGTTDMNWYRVEQEDFYKEDATLEIKITCKFEELNEDERGAFLKCLSYEDENKKIPCLYLHWTCRYLSSFNPPRPVVNIVVQWTALLLWRWKRIRYCCRVLSARRR